MQKKIIALAVAGLVSGAAFAQSNVTIYGSLDESYVYAKGNGASGTNDKTFSGISGGQWNGNRIGFKGTEDLGNGLKAVFQYEFGAALEGQGGIGSTRNAFVGVSTNYGDFTVGRQNTPAYVLMGKNSAFEIAAVTPMNNIIAAETTAATPLGMSSMGTGNTARWNNSIAFTSKDYSGFSARAMYAFSDIVSGTSVAASTANVTDAYTTSTSDNGKLGLSGTYANGGLNLDLIYQGQYNVRVSTPNSNSAANFLTGNGDNINEIYFGGSYDFKVVKVYGSYQTLRNKNTNATTYNSDSDIWSVGLSAPVSAAGTIRAEYAKVEFDRNTASSLYNGGSYSYGIGYTHDLSKRTRLYTTVTYTNNDIDSMAIGPNGISGVGVAGQSNTAFNAGIRHFF